MGQEGKEVMAPYFNRCQGDDRVHGAVLDGKRAVLDLASEQGNRIGHEQLRRVEAPLGQQLLV